MCTPEEEFSGSAQSSPKHQNPHAQENIHVCHLTKIQPLHTRRASKTSGKIPYQSLIHYHKIIRQLFNT